MPEKVRSLSTYKSDSFNRYGTAKFPSPIYTILISFSRVLIRSVRIFEGIKDKAQNEALYSSVVAQLKPTIDELGLSTPEELGLNKACTFPARSRLPSLSSPLPHTGSHTRAS